MVKRSRLKKKTGRKKVTRLKRKKPNWVIFTDPYGDRELNLDVNITRNGKKLDTLRVLEDTSAKEVEGRLYKKSRLPRPLVFTIFRVHKFDTVKETRKFADKIQRSSNPIKTLDI